MSRDCKYAARSASDESRGAATELSHGRSPWLQMQEMSPVRGERICRRSAAHCVDAFNHGFACCFALSRSCFAQPWLGSTAAPRLYKEAAAPQPRSQP
jgi:hypothetical protein